jgi:ubiquinone/menaquinone biosynthesis C-methylase UbiE
VTANRPHPMMPDANHDELAEQKFVLALKIYAFAHVDPLLSEEARAVARKLEQDGKPAPFREVRRELASKPIYQNWLSTMRTGQEMMWQAAADCVDRQVTDLEERAQQAPALGSLRVDPDFETPAYLAAADTHMQPGGYDANEGDADVRQGAIYDKAAWLYSLGRQGGELADMRGHVVVQHIMERFPGFVPKRILDMGCTVGCSTVAVASYYPDAEFHAIDVGASVLRYAHARAAHLGAAVHFSQQSAEQTDFDDNSFDLVYSCAVLHETSNQALKKIFRECHRILRPGGLMVHLEVPVRAEESDEADVVAEVRGDYEARYNNEPFWKGIAGYDVDGLARDVGFDEVAADFQDAVNEATPDAEPGFRQPNKGAYRSWYMVSGRKQGG